MSKRGFFIRDILENNGSSGENRPEVEQPLITFPNFLNLPTPNIMAYPGMLVSINIDSKIVFVLFVLFFLQYSMTFRNSNIIKA